MRVRSLAQEDPLEESIAIHSRESHGHRILVGYSPWGHKRVGHDWATSLLTTAVATGLEKSVFIPIPKKGNAKECSNYRTVALISHASKVMLKILQARLQQYVNRELSDVQAGFRKGRGTRDQIANIRWIMEKAREFR